MKWPMIIPAAFIASIVTAGCSDVEEEAGYQQPEPGEVAIEEGTPGAASVGEEDEEPL